MPDILVIFLHVELVDPTNLTYMPIDKFAVAVPPKSLLVPEKLPDTQSEGVGCFSNQKSIKTGVTVCVFEVPLYTLLYITSL